MTILLVVLAILALIVAGLVGFTANTARKIEAAFPPPGRFMEIDGQRIHYVDQGQGPAIVMIHGLGGNLMHYSYALADRLAKDHRVLMIDRPGSGHSLRPKDRPANLAAQAETIATLIRKLELDRPVLVGHSLGGALSLTIAANHPDCAGAVALIAPLTHARQEVPPAFKGLEIASRPLRTAVSWTIALPLSILNSKKVLGFVFGPDPVPDDFPTRAGGLLGLRPKAFYNTSSDLMAVNDDMPAVMQSYGAIACPIGMLFGRGDKLLDYRIDGEGMKQTCPQLDLRLMEGGHMLPLTAPEPCETLIRDIAARRYAAAAA
ncbi:MAG: alpha/beta hydrolase [Xanthobacteraceae bacterium]|nr:alpha/beta hydrolase [Xanthobacteraceae bacterium]